MSVAIIAPPSSRRVHGPRLVWAACSSVPSEGVSRIAVACATAITAAGCGQVPTDRNGRRHVSARPDRTASERVRDVVIGAGAVGDGDELSAGASSPGRGELRLVAAPGGGAARADQQARAGARRLRVAPAHQLELVPAREGSRSGVVWAGLPEPTRHAVLVLLARLISAGAIEEESL